MTLGVTTYGSQGRFGRSGIRMTAGLLQKAFSPNTTLTSGVIGFAFKFTSSAGEVRLIRLLSGGAQTSIWLETGVGRFNWYRGDGSTVLAQSSVEAIKRDTWNYIELKWTISNSISADSCILRINGDNAINLTAGTDTQFQATSDTWIFDIWGGASGMHYADLYVCDQSGPVNNSFLGDLRVDCMYPNGNGDLSQFTGSDSNSIDNYLLADDPTPDDDTTYVQTDVAGNTDLYNFESLPVTPTSIHGVQLCTMARKTDMNARKIRNLARSNGDDFESADINLSDNYVVYREILEEDPDTNLPWDETGFNAAQFGYKLQS